MSKRVYDKGNWVVAHTDDYKRMQDNLKLAREVFLDMFRTTTAGYIMAGTDVDLNRDALRDLVSKWQCHEDTINHVISELVDIMGDSHVRG